LASPSGREVCPIHSSSANAVEEIGAKTQLGRTITGVLHGFSPQGVKGTDQVKTPKDFLSQIGENL